MPLPRWMERLLRAEAAPAFYFVDVDGGGAEAGAPFSLEVGMLTAYSVVSDSAEAEASAPRLGCELATA